MIDVPMVHFREGIGKSQALVFIAAHVPVGPDQIHPGKQILPGILQSQGNIYGKIFSEILVQHLRAEIVFYGIGGIGNIHQKCFRIDQLRYSHILFRSYIHISSYGVGGTYPGHLLHGNTEHFLGIALRNMKGFHRLDEENLRDQIDDGQAGAQSFLSGP